MASSRRTDALYPVPKNRKQTQNRQKPIKYVVKPGLPMPGSGDPFTTPRAAAQAQPDTDMDYPKSQGDQPARADQRGRGRGPSSRSVCARMLGRRCCRALVLLRARCQCFSTYNQSTTTSCSSTETLQSNTVGGNNLSKTDVPTTVFACSS